MGSATLSCEVSADQLRFRRTNPAITPSTITFPPILINNLTFKKLLPSGDLDFLLRIEVGKTFPSGNAQKRKFKQNVTDWLTSEAVWTGADMALTAKQLG